MLRQIVFLLLLVLLKPYNATRQTQSNVFTFLRTDKGLPGPSMTLNKSLASGVFEFEFKTFVDRALILYQDDNGISDHIQITFQNGRLWFSFYVSQNNKSIHRKFTSEHKYNDFNWHTVRIERNASTTSFIIDNGRERKKFETYGYQSSFTSALSIGGLSIDVYPNEISNPGAFWIYVLPISKRGFFNACVRNIRYGETRRDMREITNEYTDKNKVEEGCNLNHCHNPDPICKNNGRCFPLKNKIATTCDCRWTGFTGPLCTETGLELTLDGTYKVKHRFTSRALNEEKYAFRIRTLQQNAILFYAGGPSNYGDFTLIEIKSSKLKVVVNFGSFVGPGTNYTATSSVEINDGKWHFVEYAKESNYFTLKVDMISTNVLLRSIGFRKMDYDDHSFLGEIAETPYKHDIKIQDFVWKVRWDTVNFVTGLFQTYEDYNAYFRVLPEYVLPIFNRKLPRTAQPLNYKITSSTPKPMSNTPTPSKHRCTEGPCSSKDESKFYVVIVLVNNCRGDVLVTTNVSGQLKIDHLKPTKTVVKSKRWKTKKWLSVSVVDATTNRTVDINGHSVIHLEPTIKKLISLKAPKMVDRSITRATTTPQTNTFSNPSRANDIQRKFPAERIVWTETDPVQPLTAEFEKFKDSFSATEGKGRQVIGQDANTDTG